MRDEVRRRLEGLTGDSEGNVMEEKPKLRGEVIEYKHGERTVADLGLGPLVLPNVGYASFNPDDLVGNGGFEVELYDDGKEDPDAR